MTVPMPAFENQPVTLNLSTVVRVLLVRRRLLAAVSVGTALLLFGLSFLLANTFKATALVMPPDHSSSSALSMVGGTSGASAIPSGALAALNMKNPSDLYVALMLSPLVEDAVIDRFKLGTLYHQTHRSIVRKALEGNTQILADGKSGIISVAVTDRDPQRAADIANGIVTAFEQFSSQLAITDAARRRLFFERQVAETKQTLTTDEDKLRNTSARTGVLEPEGTARAIVGYEEQLQGQLAAKTVELQSLKVYLSDDNPQVQVAEREVSSLRQQADKLAAKSGGGTTDYSNAGASTASLEYARNLRDVKADETLYELLLKNLEIAKLDEAREGNIIQVVSPATAPDLKNGPHRSFILVGGFLLGFIGASMWALVGWGRRWAAGSPPNA
jgi:tyrosine-protein kinase Etk/Wzc